MPYIGEIRMFAGTFAPVGWAFCDGQPQAISENDALFVLIGTTYGGDGEETFNLPDLRGRLPMHMGTGPDGTTYQIGEMAGVESVTLSTQQIPAHNHPLVVSSEPATTPYPPNRVLGATLTSTPYYVDVPAVALNAQSVSPIGGSQPHENMQPYLCVNFIISLYGLFPQQT